MKKLLFIAAIILFSMVLWALAPMEPSDIIEVRHERPGPNETVFTITSSIDALSEFPEMPCHIRLDPITGKPNMVIGCGLPIDGYEQIDRNNALSAALSFIDRNRNLTGVDPIDLTLKHIEWSKNKAIIRFDQVSNGVPVWCAGLTLTIFQNGKVGFYMSSLVPEIGKPAPILFAEDIALRIALNYIEPQQSPRRIDKLGLFIYPEWNKAGFVARTVWVYEIVTDKPLGRWLVMVDVSNGEIVSITNELRTVTINGSVSGFYHPQFMSDPLTVGEWCYARVSVNGFYAESNINGEWTYTIPVESPWDYATTHYGRYCRVLNDAGAEASFSESFSSTPHIFTWPETTPTDEMNTYYHINKIHNFVKDTLGFTGMDYRIVATVNYASSPDNANYDGSGVNFGGGGTTFYDMSLFCDVLYHEYTHGVTHHIYSSLPYSGESGALDEGMADYFACSMTDNPRMGDGGLYRSGTPYMRRCDTDKIYPDDFVGQVHSDGEIVSACWWAIRDAEGRYFADSLIHLTRFTLASNFTNFFWATLTTDDDDGNIYNGTPHGRLIYESYGAHGIGPGFVLDVDHRPLRDTEQDSGSYRVQATFHATLGVAPDSAKLFWRVDGGSWNMIVMSQTFGVYRAYIPARPVGSVINYYIRSMDNGSNPICSPRDAPASYHTFSVIVDSTAPYIFSMPIARWFEYAWPPSINATITDNQGILYAKIYGRIGTTVLTPTNMVESDTWDTWIGALPGLPNGGDTVLYWIEAVDVSRASNRTIFPPSGSYRTAVIPGYLEDMEVLNRGLTTYSIREGYVNNWRQGPNNSPFSTGSNGYQFNTASGRYSNSADGALSTPELRIGRTATLTFSHRIQAERNTTSSGYAWDGGIVEVSTDAGSNWQQVFPTPGYNYRITSNPASPFTAGTYCYSGEIAWRRESVDLSPFSPRVMVRFRFGSDANTTREGWFIDDIQLITDLEGIESERTNLPEFVSLRCSPNPFNSAVKIDYRTPSEKNKKISIGIFDMAGRMVWSIKPEALSGRVIWKVETSTGEIIPSGIYFVRLECEAGTITRKIILIR